MLDSDIMDQVFQQMRHAVALAADCAPEFAKIYRKLYEGLVSQGFSEEEAMRIIVNYNPSLGK